MNIEEVREFCLSLPMATEDFPFDETTLVFRIFGKIFGLLSLDGDGWFAVKCDPDYAVELRLRYTEIQPAFHMNKRHWNQIAYSGGLSNEFIKSMVRHSYSQVVRKLPQRIRKEYQEIIIGDLNRSQPLKEFD